MGFLGDMFGSSKGMGAEFSGIPIDQGVNTGQTQQAYNSAQTGLSQQANFLNALSAQNGINNQSQVFQQQQQLANQLGQMAQGGGPNPAQSMLNQATGQNVAAQNALMAGQRGANANVGLIARQAAQQGANTQQNAVGQAATMQAQQQLAATAALQQQQAMMGGLASQQVGQQAGALTGFNQAAQNEQQMLQNALSQYNNARVGMQSNINNANAGIQGQIAGAQGGLFGGLLGGAGSAAMLAANKGGMVPGYANGGAVGPSSKFGQYLQGWSSPSSTQPQELFAGMNGNTQASKAVYAGANQFGKGIGTAIAGQMNKPIGGLPSSPLDNGMSTESAIPGFQLNTQNMSSVNDPLTQAVAGGFNKGGKIGKSLKNGGGVGGKAKISGDNIKNDTVPAMLSPGEVVIPRSVMNSSDPVNNAAKFVQAVMARHNAGSRK